ncbi:MAG: hypothetical protein ACYC4L_04670 [Chloroflexota bacterium]
MNELELLNGRLLHLLEVGKTISAASRVKILAAIAALQELVGEGQQSEAKRDEVLAEARALLEAELSYSQREGLLRAAIQDSLGEPKKWIWLRDIFDDWAVYEDSTQNALRLYKVSYSILDGKVTLGEPIEVRVETKYVAIGQQTESADVELTGDLVPLVEKALGKNGTVPIKIIQPGWGSSGHYPAEVLKRDGPTVFKAGLHMHVDHPTAAEEAERPERSVNTLGAVLTSDARWEEKGLAGPGLYADAKPLGGFKERLAELAPHIGVSIRALGKAKTGEAEGKRGPIIEAITAAKSIDFVTTPGAGGQVLSLFEAARGGQTISREEVHTVDENEAQALREAKSVAEAENTTLKAENARLKEGALLREARDFVVQTLAVVDMPELTRARLTESLATRPMLKEGALDREAFKAAIDEAAKSELEYLAKATGSGKVFGMGPSTPAGDGASLKESYKLLGLSDEQAAIAAAGR